MRKAAALATAPVPFLVAALLPALAAALLAPPARADLGKLNATARAALHDLTTRATTARPGPAEGAAAAGLDAFIVGPASRAALEAAGARVRTALPGLCTARIPLAALEAVTDLPGVTRVDGAVRLELSLDRSVPLTGAGAVRGPGPDFTGLNGEGVLIGDVDTGIDYHHDDFKDAQGHTRLAGVWDQTDPGGPAPAAFGYGSEWTPADLDAGTARERDLDGHGTHVLGIAGGDGSGTGGGVPAFTYAGMAPRARLAMVKTDFTDTGILDGVAWVFQQAGALGLPAVCNLSLGTQYGPHDGSSPLEAGLEALSGPGRVVCVAAGNDRGIAKHARVTATASGGVVTLYVQQAVLGSRCGVVGYYDRGDSIDVQVRTPSTLALPSTIGPIACGQENAPYPGVATSYGQVYVANGLTLYPSGQREFYIELNQGLTQNIDGEWIVTLKSHLLGPAAGRVDLWRVNNTAPALFFTGSDTRELLVTEPGNAEDVITVGACNTRTDWLDCQGVVESFYPQFGWIGGLCTFSSPGPTRDGRAKPDLVAPGAEIASATSFDTAPQCAPAYGWNLPDSLMHRINQGTSMAAPHVAGACALLFQKFGPLDPASLKQYLFAHAVVDTSTGAVWNRDWGRGKLFLGDLAPPLTRVLSPNGGERFATGGSALLQWSAVDSASGVTGVDLLLSRAGPGGPFETIATGRPNSGAYTWAVSGPATTDACLEVVAHDGSGNSAADVSDQPFTIGADVAADPSGIRAFALAPCAPNPVGAGPLAVRFAVPRTADVALVVTDVRGRIVATLARGRYAPGRYELRWDRAARDAGRVAPGLYFLRLDTPDGARTRRVVVTG